MSCMYKNMITLRSCAVYHKKNFKCPDSKDCPKYEKVVSYTTSTNKGEYIEYESDIQYKNML